MNEYIKILKEEVNNFIYESYYSDIEKIENEWGLELIDSKDIDDYKLFLVYNPEQSQYQIGMTSKERPFSTPTAQEKIEMEFPLKNIKKNLMEMRKVINYWLNKYSSEISIGSHNQEKTIKYKNILKHMGFTVSEIFNVFNYFWVFELKK